MLNEFEQIPLDKLLSQDELQRYIFRLVEDLNFKIGTVEDESKKVDIQKIINSIPSPKTTTYYTWVKYSPYKDGTDMTNTPDQYTRYVGISYNNVNPNESTDPTDYTWTEYAYSDGVAGVTIVSASNQYYYSDSPTTLHDGGWSSTIPTFDAYRYLWIRQYITYSNGETETTAPIHDPEMDAILLSVNSAEGRLDASEGAIGDINVAISDYASSISDLDDRVGGVEGAVESLDSNYTSLDGRVNSSEGRIGDIEISLEDYATWRAGVDAYNTQTTATISQTSTSLQGIIDRFDDYKSDADQWMKFESDGLTLGAEGSPFRTKIDNQKIGFWDGETETAFVSGELFNMNNARLLGTMKKGGYEEQVQNDGGVYVVWVGL